MKEKGMQKQKFNLDSDLIVVDDIDDVKEITAKADSHKITKSERLVKITLEVPESIRHEVKNWCVKNDLSIKDALLQGFQFVKNKNKG